MTIVDDNAKCLTKVNSKATTETTARTKKDSIHCLPPLIRMKYPSSLSTKSHKTAPQNRKKSEKQRSYQNTMLGHETKRKGALITHTNLVPEGTSSIEYSHNQTRPTTGITKGNNQSTVIFQSITTNTPVTYHQPHLLSPIQNRCFYTPRRPTITMRLDNRFEADINNTKNIRSTYNRKNHSKMISPPTPPKRHPSSSTTTISDKQQQQQKIPSLQTLDVRI
jgi:hypothetical protein